MRIKTIFIQVTSRCNFDCYYCSVKKKENPYIDVNMLCDFLIRISKNIDDTVLLVFTGGEPLLLGYKNLSYYIEKITGTLRDKNISWGIQTNGYLLNIDTTNLLKSYKFNVSVSFDGLNSGSNLGREKQEIVWDKIKSLKAAMVDFKLVSVLTSHNERYLDDMLVLLEKNEIVNIRINNVQNIGMHKEYGNDHISYDVIFSARKKILEYMIKDTVKLVEFNTYNSIRKFLGLRVDSCFSPDCTKSESMIFLDCEGYVYPCFENYEQFYLNQNKKIHARTFTGFDFAKNSVYSEYRKLRENCDYCFANTICDNGCPMLSYNNINDFLNSCIANQMLFPFYIEYQKKIDRKFNK